MDVHRLKSSIGGYLYASLLTGAAIIVPVLITVFVLLIILDIFASLLNPIVIPVQEGMGNSSPLLSQVVAFVLLILAMLAVGAFNESRIGGNRLKEGLDGTMAQIPGISSIYGPLDQMSEMLLEGDTENFQEVVLVEFPREDSYALAFQTSHPPAMIEEVTESEDMLTVFMPMGPNPFMGGFIMHVAEEEVYHIDLSVEEGISSILSFGVAVEVDDHPRVASPEPPDSVPPD